MSPNSLNGRYKTVGLLLSLLSLANLLHATTPELKTILPTGAQRGTEVEITFGGDRLQDTQEILTYESGIEVEKLGLITNKSVKAQLKISPACALGEHHLRLRTATGLSDLRTFMVGPFPVVNEIEPNDTPAKAQKIELNTTVAGVVKNEDVDCFAVELHKGQRFSAEVEGMRLGRAIFDPRLAVLAPDGSTLVDVDDTWLARQDPFVSLIAPKDGNYIVRVREATYEGADNYNYLLHLGTFPRPACVYPAGGQAGETLSVTFFSEASGKFKQDIKLPDEPQEMFGVFPTKDGETAPTPNWVRISDFPNALATPDNQDRQHATPVERDAPFALNGIIASKGEEQWFRFPATKGTALSLNMYARRLHSPMDSVIEVFDASGHSVAANDDAVGADSALKFTPNESTNYFVRIRDTLGHGGREFVYRLEVTPSTPALEVKIPEVARNDTQSRQFATVPCGNRFATLISIKRVNLSGPVTLSAPELPQGIKMDADPLAANVDSIPVVFEAAADAPIGVRLLDLIATGSNATHTVRGKFHQEVELAQGPNNTTYYTTTVNKFCVATTKEAPFKVRIVEPKVPLVQGGSMPLEVVADRAPGFEEPITLQMVWNPPGVSSQSEATIEKGATNAVYQLNASGSAETKSWRIAVLGHASVEGGPLYVSSQLAPLEVAEPFVTGKIETVWTNPGKPARLTVSLAQAKPFDGKAIIRLMGLPEKVTTSEQQISSADKEVVFALSVATNCPVGNYKNLFCSVDVNQNGQVIPHSIAQGGILRVVTPKKNQVKLAATGGKHD